MKIKIKNEKFQKKLGLHKTLIAMLDNSKNEKEFENALIGVIKTGKKLALFYSNFRCQARECSTTENLTYHHIIERYYSEYIDSLKYKSQRNYWANLLIICAECHKKIHNRKPTDKMETIPVEEIEKIKKKFEVENDTGK